MGGGRNDPGMTLSCFILLLGSYSGHMGGGRNDPGMTLSCFAKINVLCCQYANYFLLAENYSNESNWSLIGSQNHICITL